MQGLMIAAPATGSGKTLVTLGLLRALKKRNVGVSAAKAGPDYIDPMFHAAALDSTCINLDPWAMRADLISALAGRATSGGRMLVVEGMMGLYDAASDGRGSSASLARSLSLPVILVIDCAGTSHSVAALARGFINHRNDIDVAGVILNRVAGERHEVMLREALDMANVRVFGVINRDAALELPARHLGLVQAQENPQLEAFIERAAEIVENAINIDELIGVSKRFSQFEAAAAVPRLKAPGRKIAVARDLAFGFMYQHILDGWARQGAELSYFSPLNDEAPDADVDAICLPGGYPELYAETLANAQTFKAAMRDAAERGVAISGECGGYMVLGDQMIDADGKTHDMLGLLPLVTSFEKRKLSLGYRKVQFCDGGLFKGYFSAHEFHYATIISQGDADPLYQVTGTRDEDLGTLGMRKGSVFGSFMHLIDRQPIDVGGEFSYSPSSEADG